MEQQRQEIRAPAEQIALFVVTVAATSVIVPIAVLLGKMPVEIGNLAVTFSAFLGVVYFGWITPNRDRVPVRILMTFALLALIPALEVVGIVAEYAPKTLYSVSLTAISILVIVRWWHVSAEIGEQPHEMVESVRDTLKLWFLKAINAKR